MKYVPSALIGRLSRSAGATTAAHNRFGAYLRNRVIPTNPQTAKQLDVRNNLTNLAQAWRELTQIQRDGWTALGAQMTRTDTLGQSYSMTGLQAFVSLNRNINTYGGTQSSAAPVLAQPVGLTSLGLTIDDTPTIGIAFTATPLAANTKIALFMTEGVSPGINFMPKGRYKLIAVSPAAQASPYSNIASAYQAVFGNPGLGTKVFARAVVIASDGQASIPFQTSTIVTEAA